VIVKPELIASAALKLFSKELIGDISTNRVAVSLPTAKAFTQSILIPAITTKDIAGAVLVEIEQTLSTTLDTLYWDYQVVRRSEDGIEIFVVAMPKKIVDSYLALTQIMGLEAVDFNTTIVAGAQLFAIDRDSTVPSVLIDFGALSTDISVYSNGLIVTGTVAFGGDNLTEILARSFKVPTNEALVLKSKFGLSPSEVRKKVLAAIEPSLEILLKEIRRTIRYYEQRYSTEAPIGQVITMGGGANMPGMATYLTEKLRLPVRPFDLASHIDYGHLHPFYKADSMSYTTAAGLATTNPKELFR
jgi:type IV pilus assembly protein PilM